MRILAGLEIFFHRRPVLFHHLFIAIHPPMIKNRQDPGIGKPCSVGEPILGKGEGGMPAVVALPVPGSL